MEKINKAFQSIYFVPVIFTISFLSWALHITEVGIVVMALSVAVILLFCKDVKNIFCPLFYCSFFIEDILAHPIWAVYGTCIAVVFFSMIYFIVKNILAKKRRGEKITLGKMFLFIVACDVAFLLGGVFNNFNLIVSLAVLGFCVLTFLFYFIAVNFTENLWRYLLKLFLIGALFICLQVFTLDVKAGGIKGIFVFYVSGSGWIGSQCSNTAAIFLLIGMISSFALGYKTEKDFLYFIIATVIAGVTVVVKCRGVLLITAPTYIALTVISIIKSEKKKPYIIALIGCVILGSLLLILDRKIIAQLIERFTQSNFSSGRIDELWPWCIERFKENIFNGIGFISLDPVPAIREGSNQFVLAHNTPLQWLVSLGIIGMLLMLFFTYGKYREVIKNFKKTSIFISFIIIAIALTGMVDQAAAMDFFVFTLPLVLIGSIEKE